MHVLEHYPETFLVRHVEFSVFGASLLLGGSFLGFVQEGVGLHGLLGGCGCVQLAELELLLPMNMILPNGWASPDLGREVGVRDAAAAGLVRVKQQQVVRLA